MEVSYILVRIGTSSNNTGVGNGGDQPGPGQYNIVNKNNGGPKISLSGKNKYSGNDIQNGPGPGNYNLNAQSVYKNISGYTIASKYGTVNV